MYTYIIDDKKVTFKTWDEVSSALDEAEKNGLTTEYVDYEEGLDGPKTEEQTNAAEEKSIIGKPGFLPDAAESADVVSKIQAQDTDSPSGDTSSGSRYIKFKNGLTIYEDDYLKNYAETEDYPKSFDDYALKFGGKAQEVEESVTEGGELDPVYVSTGPQSYVTELEGLNEFGEITDGQVTIDYDSLAKENGFGNAAEAYAETEPKREILNVFEPNNVITDRKGNVTTRFKYVEYEDDTPEKKKYLREQKEATDYAVKLALNNTEFSANDITDVNTFNKEVFNPDYLSKQANYLTKAIPQLNLYQAELAVANYNNARLQLLKDKELTDKEEAINILQEDKKYAAAMNLYESEALNNLPKAGKELGIAKNKLKEAKTNLKTIDPTAKAIDYTTQVRKINDYKEQFQKALTTYSNQTPFDYDSEGNFKLKDQEAPIITDLDYNILTPQEVEIAKSNGQTLLIENERYKYNLDRASQWSDRETIKNNFLLTSIDNDKYTAKGKEVYYIKTTSPLSDPQLAGFADTLEEDSPTNLEYLGYTNSGKRFSKRRKKDGEYRAYTLREISNAINEGDWSIDRIKFKDGKPEGFNTDRDFSKFSMDYADTKMMLPIVTDMYVLGLDPGTQGEDTGVNMGAAFIDEVLENSWGLFGDGLETTREKKDAQRFTLEKIGLPETESMKKSFERGFMMRLSESAGAFVPVLGEFGVATALTGGVGNVLGTGRFIKTAFSEGKNLGKAAQGAWKSSYWGRNPRAAKFAAHMLKFGEEEIKFSMVARGENTLGSGGAFYLGSLLTQRLVPFRFNRKYNWANFANKTLEKVVLTGVGGASSSELSHLSEAFYKEFTGDKSLKTSMDEFWGDDAETMTRWSINLIQFSFLGATKMKKWDRVAESTVQELNNTYIKQRNKALSEGKDVEKLNQKIYETDKILELGKTEVQKSDVKALQDEINKIEKDVNSGKLSYSERQDAMNRRIANEKQIEKLQTEFENKQLYFKKEFGIDLVFGEVPGSRGEISPDGKTLTIDKNKLSEGVLQHEMGHWSMIMSGRKNGLVDKMYESIYSRVEDAIKATQLRGDLQLTKTNDAQGNPRKTSTLQQVLEAKYGKNNKVLKEEFIMFTIEFMKNNKSFSNSLLNRGVIQSIYKDLAVFANNKGINFGKKPINLNNGSKDNRADAVIDLLYKMANAKGQGYKENVKALGGVAVDRNGAYSMASGEKLLDQKQLKSREIQEEQSPEYKKLKAKRDANNQKIIDFYEENKTTRSRETLADDLNFQFLDHVKFHARKALTLANQGKFPTESEIYEAATAYIYGLPTMGQPGGKTLAEKAIMPFFRGQDIIAAIKRDNLSVEQTIGLLKQGSIPTGAKTYEDAAKDLHDMATGKKPEASIITYVNNAIKVQLLPDVIKNKMQEDQYVTTADTQKLEYFAEQMSEYGEGEVFSEKDVKDFKEAATVDKKDMGYDGVGNAKRRTRDSAMNILNIKPETRVKVKDIVVDKIKNEPIEGLDAFSVGTINFGKGKIFDIEVPTEPNRANAFGPDGVKIEFKGIRKPADIFEKLIKIIKKDLTNDIIDQTKTPEQVAEAKAEMERILNLKFKRDVSYEKEPTRLFRVGLERKAEADLYQDIRAEMGEVGSEANLRWLAKARALIDNYIDLSQITKRFDLDVLYEKVYKLDASGKPVLNAKGQKVQARSGERASGNLIFKKKAISAKEYFDYFKDNVVRQESLAKALAREFAFDQIVDVLKADAIKKISIKEGQEITTIDMEKGSEIFREDMFKHIRRGSNIEKLYSKEILASAEERQISEKDFIKGLKDSIFQLNNAGWESLDYVQKSFINDVIRAEMVGEVANLRTTLKKDAQDRLIKDKDRVDNHFENLNKEEFEKRQKGVMYGIKTLFGEIFNETLNKVAKSRGGNLSTGEFLNSRILGANDIKVGLNLGLKNLYEIEGKAGANYGIKNADALYKSSSKSDAAEYFKPEALENLKTNTKLNNLLNDANTKITEADKLAKIWYKKSGMKYEVSKVTLDQNSEVARTELFRESDKLRIEQPKLSTSKHANILFTRMTAKIGKEGVNALIAESNALQATQRAVLYTMGLLGENVKGKKGNDAMKTMLWMMSENNLQGSRKMAPEIWYDFNTIYEASSRNKQGKITKNTINKIDKPIGNEHLLPRAAYWRKVFQAYNSKKLTDNSVLDALVGGYESMIGKKEFQNLSDALTIPNTWTGKTLIKDAPVPFLGKLLIATTPGKSLNEAAWKRVLGDNGGINMRDLNRLNNIRKLDGTTALQQWGRDLIANFESSLVKQSIDAAVSNKRLAKALKLPEGANGKQILESLEPSFKSKEIQEKGESYEEYKERKQTPKGKLLEKELAAMIERKGGAPAEATVSDSKAFMEGKKRWDDLFIPSNSMDFRDFLYKGYGKGKQGDKDMAFMEEHVLRPLTRAENALSVYRMKLAEDYAALEAQIKTMGETKPEKEAAKRVEKLGYNIDQAVRVWIWQKLEMDIPGISLAEKSQLTGAVMSSPKLKAYANGIMDITKTKEKYPEPSANWFRSNVQYDLFTHATDGVRADFLYEWQENVDAMFTKENLNKLESRFGSKYRYNLQQMLTRIAKGKSRPESTNDSFNTTLNYINGSVATIMFLNMRSAALQTISAANYVNWTDNNPIEIAKVISENPKLFIETAKKIWSSDALRDRRTGLKINVQEAEMAKAMKQGGRSAAQEIWDQMIKIGFKPTQMADSFAIVMGGTPFYMNRMKTYEKEGMSKNKAADKAFEDFLDKTQEGQQSSQMDRISNIQTGLMGRLVFSFNNTPFQMSRLQKKAFLDLKNNRGDKKTNISRLAYYGLVQSSIFYGMQQAFYSTVMTDDEELSEKEKAEKYTMYEKRVDKLGRSVWQGILTGSGLPGKLSVMGYNTALEAATQYKKGYQGSDFFPILSQILSVSPTLGSKVNRLGRNWKSLIMAEKTKKGIEFGNTFNTLDPRNPNNKAYISMVGTITNIPLDRIVQKMENLSNAFDAQNELWQRAAMLMGTPKYQLQTKEQNDRDRQNKLDTFYLNNTSKGQRDIDAIESLNIKEQKDFMKALGGTKEWIKTLDTQSERTSTLLYLAKEAGIDIEKQYEKYEYKEIERSEEYKEIQEWGRDKQIDWIKANGINPDIMKFVRKSEADRIYIIQELMKNNKNKQNSLK